MMAARMLMAPILAAIDAHDKTGSAGIASPRCGAAGTPPTITLGPKRRGLATRENFVEVIRALRAETGAPPGDSPETGEQIGFVRDWSLSVPD